MAGLDIALNHSILMPSSEAPHILDAVMSPRIVVTEVRQVCPHSSSESLYLLAVFMAEACRGRWSSNTLQGLWFWSLLLLVILVLSPSPALGQLNPTLWTSFVPLAVRSPYLSAWMNTTDVSLSLPRAPELWPSFWPTSDVCILRNRII